MHDARGMQAFVAVAEHRSFSLAARTLGVTTSALSQAVRGFEGRVGAPLLARTTRSVSLTDAGRTLLSRLAPVLRETESALEEARGAATTVQGTLRLLVARSSVPLVVEPVLGPLLAQHSRLSVDVTIEDRFVDIVAQGFDAGIRVGDAVEPDFTALRLTPPFRLLVAGSPAYLAAHGRPAHPTDLRDHECLNHRKASTGAFSPWRFERRKKKIEVGVRGRVACNDLTMMLNAALAGLGLIYFHEPGLRPHVDRGALSVVLEDFAPTLPGFFLYFPRTSGAQPKIRALVEALTRLRAKGGSGSSPRRPAGATGAAAARRTAGARTV